MAATIKPPPLSGWSLMPCAIQADQHDFERVVFGTTESLYLVRLDVHAAQDFVNLRRLDGLGLVQLDVGFVAPVAELELP